MTEQTYAASTTGFMNVYVTSHIGKIRVITGEEITKAEVKISTTAGEGAVAKAVQDATIRQHGNQIDVRVPMTEGTDVGMGRRVTVMDSSTVMFHQGVGGSGVQMLGGTAGAGEITVTLRLPVMSSVKVTTSSADVVTEGTTLQVLDVDSQSGDVMVDTVRQLTVQTMSGEVMASRVDCEVNVATMSGDVRIGAYNGTRFSAETMSGDINASATPAASGPMALKSMSGDISTRGARHLSPRSSSMSGSISNS